MTALPTPFLAAVRTKWDRICPAALLLVMLLTPFASAQGQERGYVYTPQSYYVVPPLYYLGNAVFAPDPLFFPDPVLVPEPVLVRGPMLAAPPYADTPPVVGYFEPLPPRGYRERLRLRPHGGHVYQNRVDAPGRRRPVYQYDERSGPQGARIRERQR